MDKEVEKGVRRKRENGGRRQLAIYIRATLLTLETHGVCRRIGRLRAPYRAVHMRAGALRVLRHPSEATGYHRRCATLSLRAFLPSGDSSGGCNPSSLHLHSTRELRPIGPRRIAPSFVLSSLSAASSSLDLLVPLIRRSSSSFHSS